MNRRCIYFVQSPNGVKFLNQQKASDRHDAVYTLVQTKPNISDNSASTISYDQFRMAFLDGCDAFNYKATKYSVATNETKETLLAQLQQLQQL